MAGGRQSVRSARTRFETIELRSEAEKERSPSDASLLSKFVLPIAFLFAHTQAVGFSQTKIYRRDGMRLGAGCRESVTVATWPGLRLRFGEFWVAMSTGQHLLWTDDGVSIRNGLFKRRRSRTF